MIQKYSGNRIQRSFFQHTTLVEGVGKLPIFSQTVGTHSCNLFRCHLPWRGFLKKNWCKRDVKKDQWQNVTENQTHVKILKVAEYKGKEMHSLCFYLFDPVFKTSTGLQQCLNCNTVTRAAIDFGIIEKLIAFIGVGSYWFLTLTRFL